MNNSLYINNTVCLTPELVTVNGTVLAESHVKRDFKTFSRELYKSLQCNYSKFYKMDNLCKLAFLSVELLVRETEITSSTEHTALLLANSGSTIDTDTNFVNTLDKIPSPAIFVYTLPNIAAGELSIRHGWKGENLFLVSDTFDAKTFDENLRMLFADSNTEACVTGWIDYFTETDYKACLWLVTRVEDKKCRILDAQKLDDDFVMNQM